MVGFTTAMNDINDSQIVGKDSQKKRDVGKFKVVKSEIETFRSWKTACFQNCKISLEL